jgi:hypothetical protein
VTTCYEDVSTTGGLGGLSLLSLINCCYYMRSFADLIACRDALSPGSVVGSTGALWSYLVLSLVSCADGGKLAL